MAIFISEKEMVLSNLVGEKRGDIMLVVCVDLNRVIIKVFNEKHQGK